MNNRTALQRFMQGKKLKTGRSNLPGFLQIPTTRKVSKDQHHEIYHDCHRRGKVPDAH